MTTNKPASRPPIKREREDDDSHESSFADVSEPNAKRVQKGAARASQREAAQNKVSHFE